jgi:hypothetical protein
MSRGLHRARASRPRLLLTAVCLAVLPAWCGVAPADWISLNGTSGLLMTPTADLVEDRRLAAGVSFVDKKWAVEERGAHDNLAYFATLGFLPRVEVSMRLTVLPGSKFSVANPDRSVKDRMFSVKALLLRERGPWPSVAVGGEDITGTKRYNTLFAVLSRRLDPGIGEFRVHLGAGAGWIEAKNHPLDGVFGGVAMRLWKGGDLIGEYDTNKVNVGFALEPLPYVRVLVAAINAESFAGGINFQLGL